MSGGGTGIGREIARNFSTSGDNVLILGRRSEVLLKTAGELNSKASSSAGHVDFLSCDLEDSKQVSELASKVAKKYTTVDVIVNNAGGVDRRDTPTLQDLSESWTSEFRSNVLIGVLLTTALLPYMRKPGGRIINMSSIAAFRGGGSYGAVKAAIVGWTFDLAKSLGKDGITANVIAPGYVSGTEFFGGSMSPERHQRLVSETLDGRSGTPSDIASIVYFLASEKTSHITGQIFHVNGGALFGR